VLQKSFKISNFARLINGGIMETKTEQAKDLSYNDFKKEIINDYKLAVTSRECSLLGRREVLTGKAKFGIFGMAKNFLK
jgi:hypothetical protein